MKAVLYPGSFDPITRGHIDVIGRLARIFDQVHVLVADNPRKTYALNSSERVRAAEAALATVKNVKVTASQELTVAVARSLGVNVIARSVRTVTDWEYEYAMAFANRKLAPEVETFFIMASPEHGHISSSLVREVAMFGGDISSFVTPEVAEILKSKLKQK